MSKALAGVALRPFPWVRSILVVFLAAALSVSVAGSVSANPRYAAIVVDARTGKTLFSANADARRYPASLTKMMTLYMTFEALQSGKITKNTRVPFSAHAAGMPPTKLGVKAGGSVTVETAILSLVTKSANDAAAALGELLGGSEEGFARIMTAKARSLGMKGTVFRNASGLPNPGQFTTARDMATLGIALREHFPQHYHYFSTRSFKFGKQRLANHNRLLGRIKGVDGIKTGFIRASGFNLVTSVVDGNRKLVAVVMGGTSGRSRDNHMAELVRTYLPKASGRGGNAPLVARADSSSSVAAFSKVILPKSDAPTPDTRPEEVALVEAVDTADEEEVSIAELLPTGAPAAAVASTEQAYAGPTPHAKKSVDPIATATVPSGWAIQVASSPSEDEARAFLTRTSEKVGKIVAGASPFTVQFEHKGTTFYRARFGGYESKTAAWNACGALKKHKIDCFAVQQ